MKRRTLSMLLAIAMLAVCMTGCGKKEEAPKNNTGEVPTLTIGIKQSPNTEDYETNEFTKFIEENVGVNLDFVYFSNNASEANQQLSLMMAGGEKLPDILEFFALGASAINEYGEDGYFIDLAPYFGTEHSKHFDEAVSKIGTAADRAKVLKMGTDPETGKLYGFPCYQHGAGVDNTTNHIVINKNWLEAVGAERPTTPDELYEVLKKFATMDPNGNGKADEMPLVGSTKVTRADTLEWITNAFIYTNKQYFFDIDNGKLTVPYVQPEYREALVFLNKLYKENLLSPQVFTIGSNDEMKEILTPSDGPAIAGLTAGHVQLIYNDNNDTLFEYEYQPSLDAGTGKGGYRQQSDSTYRYSTFITSDCENPDLAFDVLDFMSSDEAFLFMRYGVEGRDWEYAEEGMLDVFGNQAVINVIDSSVFSSQNNVNWHILDTTIADYTTHGMYSPPVEATSFTARYNAWKDQYIKEMFADETKDELMFNVVYPGSVTEELNELATPIRDYVSEARALFVTGTKDPNNDADWNAYLNDLTALGLDRYLQITQDAYDAMNK
ncbi:MAG: extracellular solute-binding protein [Oscillibacter sp.]|nr:extracellular solute-binding protein [Oscillibacter sp.]